VWLSRDHKGAEVRVSVAVSTESIGGGGALAGSTLDGCFIALSASIVPTLHTARNCRICEPAVMHHVKSTRLMSGRSLLWAFGACSMRPSPNLLLFIECGSGDRFPRGISPLHAYCHRLPVCRYTRVHRHDWFSTFRIGDLPLAWITGRLRRNTIIRSAASA
jgi:hypothetical protein